MAFLHRSFYLQVDLETYGGAVETCFGLGRIDARVVDVVICVPAAVHRDGANIGNAIYKLHRPVLPRERLRPSKRPELADVIVSRSR